MDKDPFIELPQISYQELSEREMQAWDLFDNARREAVHWALQEAYRLLREAYSGATRLLVNACLGQDEACWIQEVRNAADVSLWRAGDTVSPGYKPPARMDAPFGGDITAMHDEADRLLNDVLTWQPCARQLSGWRELKRKSGIYVVDMDMLTQALPTDRVSVRPEVTAVVRAGLSRMPYDTATATKRYAQLLVDGRTQSRVPGAVINALVSCPVDGSALSHHPRQAANFSLETWEEAIALVHGLGAGAVMDVDTGDVWGTANQADVRFAVTTQDLVNDGITLEEFSVAFSGARSAALAIVQAH